MQIRKCANVQMPLNAGLFARWRDLRIWDMYFIFTFSNFHIFTLGYSGLNLTTNETAVHYGRHLRGL
jgi:hypothetical protein